MESQDALRPENEEIPSLFLDSRVKGRNNNGSIDLLKSHLKVKWIIEFGKLFIGWLKEYPKVK